MNRTFVITGAASGIGAALVTLVRDRGDIAIGVDLAGADVVGDLSVPAGRAGVIEDVLDAAHGRIDAVIANAGLALPVAKTVAVNYFGAVEVIDALLPVVARAEHPRVVVTSSMATLMPVRPDLVEACLDGDETTALAIAGELEAAGPQVGQLIYPSSKRALSRWVRRESVTPRFAGAGIPLNAVGPGIVRTPMTADLLATPEATAAVDAMVPMPLGGHLEARQTAYAILWLASVENTHVCGQTLYVDGGSDAVLRGDDVWSWADHAVTV